MVPLQIQPWFSMWLDPRRTVEAVCAYKKGYGFILLSAITGWPTALQIAQIFPLSGSVPFPWIVAMTLLAAPVLGAVGILLFTAFLYFAGKGLGGKASFAELKCAVTWSNITGVTSVLEYAILLTYFGSSWFSLGPSGEPVYRYMGYLLFVFLILQIVSFGWMIYLLIQSIAAVQKFEVWKSVVNAAIGVAVLQGSAWLCAWLM